MPGADRSWLDGRIREADEIGPELYRATRYGDGLFATLRIESGALLDLPLQAERLLAGAQRLELDPPAGFDDAGEIAHRLLTIAVELGAGAGSSAVLRCQWSAAGSERGYRRGRKSVALIELSPAPAPRRPTVRLLSDDSLPLALIPDVKSCSALPHVLAGRAASGFGVDEVVRVHEGCVTEAVSANLFFEREGQLLTPEVRLPLYPGIVRQRVLDVAEALGLEVLEGRYSTSHLLGCDAAFLTNSVRGLETVASIDGRALGATPLVNRVSSAVRVARERDAVPLPGAAT